MNQKVSSPAKINLFLYVTGRRSDGFHELFTLMVPLDIWDILTFDFEGEGICVWCDHPSVPDGEENLAFKAAGLFMRAALLKTGRSPFPGVKIKIQKNIPVGGGLGGGSGNAAAVLTALNRRAGNLFSQEQLETLGLELGADVPFFIRGVPAFARGVGEKLEICRNLPPFYAVVCTPMVVASTARVFKNLDYRLTLGPNYTMNTGSNVLPSGQGPDKWVNLHNDLEESACRLYPEIRSTKEEMGLLLNRRVFMSGSGSSLFALITDRDEAINGVETLSRAWAGRQKRVFLARAMHSDN